MTDSLLTAYFLWQGYIGEGLVRLATVLLQGAVSISKEGILSA